MPTSSEIKGIEEQLNELHTDKVSLRWFRTDSFYLYTDFASGSLYWDYEDKSLASYRFEGASRLIEVYLKTDPIQTGANLVLT